MMVEGVNCLFKNYIKEVNFEWNFPEIMGLSSPSYENCLLVFLGQIFFSSLKSRLESSVESTSLTSVITLLRPLSDLKFCRNIQFIALCKSRVIFCKCLQG